MNFSLKPNTIIAHFLPGAFFLAVVVATLLIENPSWLDHLEKLTGGPIAVLAGIGFSLALLIGLVIDAIRNLLEPIWDKHGNGKWWNFFFQGDEKLQNLMDHYYGFYVFDANLLITIVLLLFLGAIVLVIKCFNFSSGGVARVTVGFLLVAVVLILFCDARSLRKEIKELATGAMSKKAEEKNGAEDAT